MHLSEKTELPEQHGMSEPRIKPTPFPSGKFRIEALLATNPNHGSGILQLKKIGKFLGLHLGQRGGWPTRKV